MRGEWSDGGVLDGKEMNIGAREMEGFVFCFFRGVNSL